MATLSGVSPASRTSIVRPQLRTASLTPNDARRGRPILPGHEPRQPVVGSWSCHRYTDAGALTLASDTGVQGVGAARTAPRNLANS